MLFATHSPAPKKKKRKRKKKKIARSRWIAAHENNCFRKAIIDEDDSLGEGGLESLS